MKRFFSVGALCAAMFALVLTGCDKDTFTVTFNSQGGSNVAAIKKVAAGENITKPEDPTKEGSDFDGWYKEAACTNAWDFAKDVVTSDVTLYAKWEKKGTINAQVQNGALYNNLVDEVRAVSGFDVETTPPEWWNVEEDGPYYDWQEFIIASAPYKNGGFMMILPEEIDSRLLEDMDLEDMPSGINVSNPNAKAASIPYFEAYKSGDYVDDLTKCAFSLSMTGFSYTAVLYMYADADVKITGTYTESYDEKTFTEKYNVDLKKGWNTVYMTQQESMSGFSGIVTTVKPNVDLKWYFEEELEKLFDGFAPQKAPKKGGKAHKLFRFF